MPRQRLDAPADAPPPGAAGAGYRKRAGKVGLTVSVTPQERDALREAAFRARQSVSAYLLAAGLARAEAEARGRAPQPAAGLPAGGDADADADAAPGVAAPKGQGRAGKGGA